MHQETENMLKMYYGKSAFTKKEVKKNMGLKRWTAEEKKIMEDNIDKDLSSLMTVFPDRSNKSIEQYRHKIRHKHAPAKPVAKKKKALSEDVVAREISFDISSPVCDNMLPTLADINKLVCTLSKDSRVPALQLLIDLHNSIK